MDCKMKTGFSLAELMIIAAILGILAAIVLPQFQSNTTEAREVAARQNIHILRAAIELYAARHNGVPPGYPLNNPSNPPQQEVVKTHLVGGQYISDLPINPFNNKPTIRMIANGADLPPGATGEYGWIYKPQTKTIRLDWPGRDKTGTRYYDY